jgi:uncharacterized protein YutD
LSSMCEPWVQYQKRKDKKKSFIITYGNWTCFYFILMNLKPMLKT